MRGYYPGEREYRRGPQPRIRRPRIPDPRERTLHLPKPRLRRRRAETAGAAAAGGTATGRRVDWVVGILLGVVLGISVIVAFLVFGSEGTIDAPNIHGVQNGQPPAQSRPAEEVRESR